MFAERTSLNGLNDNFFSTLLKRAPQIIAGGATGYLGGGGVGLVTGASTAGLWDTKGKVIPGILVGAGTGVVVGTATGAVVEATKQYLPGMLPEAVNTIGTG